MPGFVATAHKLAHDDRLYKILVSKENVALLREGADGVTKPFLRRNGRFVENVDLVRMPPDVAGAAAVLAVQAALTEISAKLDRIARDVADLDHKITAVNRGALRGALNALDVAGRLEDPGERRGETFAACREVVVQLGVVTGQLGAHIRRMPPAETGLWDGWDAGWLEEARGAYDRVRDDFAIIGEGLHRVVDAYWQHAEYASARTAVSRVCADLDVAGLDTAARRARLLPFDAAPGGPERVFRTFRLARPRLETRLRDMAAGAVPEVQTGFRWMELLR